MRRSDRAHAPTGKARVRPLETVGCPSCRATSRHVEGKGLPTPRRIRRQREILNALSLHYAALPRSAGGAPSQRLRPVASFGFSRRTSPEDAVAKLVAILNDVDPAWRSFVKVWDGVNGGVQHAVRG